MDIIISEVDRLAILVNDILELSSMQSNINELNKVDFDLIHLTNEILHRYKVLQETENYIFEFNHSDQELIINADKKKMMNILKASSVSDNAVLVHRNCPSLYSSETSPKRKLM